MRIPVASLVVGDFVDDVFLLVDCRRLSNKRTGRDGLKWTVRDVSGMITVIVWDTTADQLTYGHTWTTLHVRGTVEPDSYTGGLQIKGKAVYAQLVDSLEGLEPVTTLQAGEYWEALRGYIERLRPPLRELVDAVLAQESVGRNFSHYPAGRSMHHAVRGGLLQHTTEVVWIADAMAQALAGAAEVVNWDLVIAAAILHDIGKVDEYEGEGSVVEYGRGALLGHITHGLFRIRDAGAAIQDFPADLLDELMHIVGAHHGKKEFGSPVEAGFLEADIVHLADVCSARASARRQTKGLKIFEKHAMLEGGQFTGDRWGALPKAAVPSLRVPQLSPPRPVPESPPAYADPQPSLFTDSERAGAPAQPVATLPQPIATLPHGDEDDPFE